MKILYNPHCSKCREALCLIEERGIEPEVVRYLEQPPTEVELKKILTLLNARPQDIIRTNEPLYKEKYKGQMLTDDQWIRLLVKNPILIERPIIIEGNKAVIGRPPTKVLDLIK